MDGVIKNIIIPIFLLIIKPFILIAIIIAAIIIIIKIFSFKSVGKTVGECVDVKVEFLEQRESPFNERLRGMDNRMYVLYVKYEWEGVEYIAKSYRSYQNLKVFPGDKLVVLVGKDDKNIVDVVL